MRFSGLGLQNDGLGLVLSRRTKDQRPKERRNESAATLSESLESATEVFNDLRFFRGQRQNSKEPV
jgi:hypothetical protein